MATANVTFDKQSQIDSAPTSLQILEALCESEDFQLLLQTLRFYREELQEAQ